MPNPFLLTDNPTSVQPQSGESDFGLASGSVDGGSERRGGQPPARPGPPQRPPPPQQTGGPLGGVASPAHGGGGPAAAAAPKSAFDDLNDTIRMALGNSGSPARQQTPAAGAAGTAGLGGGNVSQNFMQQASPPQPSQPQTMYSSPAKQPAPGLGLCQNPVP